MTHDEWRLLRYGMFAAALVTLVLLPILVQDRTFPRLAGEAVIDAVVLATFLLSKYLGAARNQTDLNLVEFPMYTFVYSVVNCFLRGCAPPRVPRAFSTVNFPVTCLFCGL
jgi:hypothetical protein